MFEFNGVYCYIILCILFDSFCMAIDCSQLPDSAWEATKVSMIRNIHILQFACFFNCIFSVFSAVYFPQQHLPHYQLPGPDSRQTGLGGCHPTHVSQTRRLRGRGTRLQHVTGTSRHHQGRYFAARDRVVTPNHRSHGGRPGNQNKAFYPETAQQDVCKSSTDFKFKVMTYQLMYSCSLHGYKQDFQRSKFH